MRVEYGKAHPFDLGSSGGNKVNGKESGGGFYVEDLNSTSGTLFADLELSTNLQTVIAGLSGFDD